MGDPVVFSDLLLSAPKHARELQAWHILRGCPTFGPPSVPGRVDRAHAMCELHSLWTGTQRLSDQQLRKILPRGHGVFWNLTRRFVYLRSPARVARALDIPSFRAGEVMEWDDLLEGPIGDIRARLAIRAVARIRRERPMSNAAVVEMLGRSKRTVQRYRRASGVRSIALFEPVAKYARLVWRAYKVLGGPRFRVLRAKGRRMICKRIPNALECRMQPTRRVRPHLRRANRSLRALRAPTSDHPDGRSTGTRSLRRGPCSRKRWTDPSSPSYVSAGRAFKGEPDLADVRVVVHFAR